MAQPTGPAVHHMLSLNSSGSERPDILIYDATGAPAAVVEVKMLSGLGERQLERYLHTVAAGTRDAVIFALISPQHLPVHVPPGSPWRAPDLGADAGRVRG